VYPKELLAAISLQYLNFGLQLMFNTAVKDLLMNTYNLDKTQAIWFDYSLQGAYVIRILFGVIIDAFQLYVDKRHYFIFGGFL
jgi:hypothetical protein